MSRDRESNPRPRTYHVRALPTELSRHGAGGRVRTFVGLRREFYRLVCLTAPPPQRENILSCYNIFMAVNLIKGKVAHTDLVKAQEEYDEYIKIVVDIETGLMTIGGEWHADGEKLLLENGSKQDNIWGGGMNLKTNKIDYTALINIRSKDNPSHVIMDKKVRDKFDKIVKNKFNL